MSELYAEAGVKRKENPRSIAIRAGLILSIIASWYISGLSTILIILPILAIVVTVIIFPRLNVEYEYVFCDGQIDFDKIMGGAKRKTMLKMDFDQIDIVAPTGSHALDTFNSKTLTKKDFSSLAPGAKTYTIIGKSKKDENGQVLRVIFEPNDKMIESMKMKAPRKVVTY